MTGTERPVRIPCGEIALEGLFSPPAQPGGPAVVVCHPHPLYGGDMHNNVVAGVCRSVRAQGWAVLRFNFRGVGRSGGGHGGGEAETADVAAALGWLAATVGPVPVFLAGYSFGAWVGSRAALRGAGLTGFAAVAPPLALYPMGELARLDLPRLVVAGGCDAYCPPDRLDAWLAGASGRVEVARIPTADHFFVGLEDEVGEAVAGFFRRIL